MAVQGDLLETVRETFTRPTNVLIAEDAVWEVSPNTPGPVITSTGRLYPSSGASRIFVPFASRIPAIADFRATAKFVMGSDVSAWLYSLVKYVDDNNYVRVEINTGPAHRITTVVGGVASSLVGGSSSSYYPLPVEGQAMWLRMTVSGNQITSELFDVDPTNIGAAPVHSLNTMLSGGEVTAFGSGVPARVGLRTGGANATSTSLGYVDEFRIEEPLMPYTYYGNVDEKINGTAVLVGSAREEVNIGKVGLFAYSEYMKFKDQFDLRSGNVVWNRTNFVWRRRK